MKAAAGRFFIGVDGGGTRCRVRIRAADGTELAFSEGGSANVHADPEGALKTLRETIDQAIAKAGLTAVDRRQTSLGLGLAGIVSMEDSDRISTAFEGYASVTTDSDAATACLGAHKGADGGLVIAGTGSAGFAMIKGTKTSIGGRGFAISDEGSAARIGWETLRQSVQAADGLIPSTKMTLQIMKKFNHDPTGVTRWTKQARASDYGALAPIAFGHAAKGDAVALPIIKQAVHSLLALRAALRRLGATRIALVGGLAEPLQPWFMLETSEAEGEPLFVLALHDAADGAILLAGGTLS